MAKAVKQLTLSEWARGVLADTGNASQYVEYLVHEHHAAWSRALEILRVNGWANHEIRAVAGLLTKRTEPVWQVYDPTILALDMLDSGRDGKYPASFRISPQRWERLRGQLLRFPDGAQALTAIARELRFVNKAVIAELERET
jgi:hypothetical protein